jgi:hypothetical protein
VPNVRDLVTNTQEGMDLPGAPTMSRPDDGSPERWEGRTIRSAPLSTKNLVPEGELDRKVVAASGGGDISRIGTATGSHL